MIRDRVRASVHRNTGPIALKGPDMRMTMLILPLLALPACAVQAPQAAAPVTAAAPFSVPMDPGTISCAALSNPAAVDAATDWAMGRARAALLAGRISSLPDTLSLGSSLATFCRENSASTVRDAAAQLGL